MRPNLRWSGYLGTVLVAASLGWSAADAQPKPLEASFTATTMGMTPAGLGLRIQVIGWSDDNARGAALVALGAENPSQALGKLPTVGYVWPTGSPVGYTVKYAYRTPTAGGGERITLVTDKALGSYDYRKWSTATPSSAPQRPYSVVELYVDASGTGAGNLSLGADVVVDDAAKTVALAPDGSAANLLANVVRNPPS